MRKIVFCVIAAVLSVVVFPTQSEAAENELPCWLSPDALMGYQYWDDPNFCMPPRLLTDPNAPDQLKDQIICDAMHQYDSTYSCFDFIYDENGMHVLDSNGKPLTRTDPSPTITTTSVVIQPTTHPLPKTGNELFILIPGLIFVLFGTALILFPKKKRG